MIGGLDLFLNSGDGTFVDAGGNLPVGATFGRELLAGDVDGDGDVDAVLVSTLAPGSRLYVNDGTGTFALGIDPTAGASSAAHSGDLGDVDGDGDLDLMIRFGSSTRLLLNDGAGAFTEVPGALPSSLSIPRFEDLDGDGDVDVWTVARSLANDGTGTFTEIPDSAPAILPVAPDRASLADVDADGDPDALIAAGAKLLYLNDGQGRFVDVTVSLPEEGQHFSRVALGDLNGDDYADVVYPMVVQPLDMLLNDGVGGFVDVSDLVSHLGIGTCVEIADVDRDGDQDLLVAGSGGVGPYVLLLRNTGTGFFEDPPGAAATLPGTPTNLATGDADGDGDLDLFVAVSEANNVLLLNDGTGAFTPGALPLDLGETTDVDVGDVDGDGDLDVAWSNEGAQNRLSLGNGLGGFVDATAQLPIDADDTKGLALTDIDGDGDLDLVFANLTAPARLAQNDGNGVFTDVTAAQLPAGFVLGRDVLPADFDDDGDVDLYGLAYGLLINTGNGAFVDGTSLLGPLGVGVGAAAADIDNDGDIDLWTTSIVLRNVTRHVAPRGVPRVGKPLEMRVFGPPASLYVLGVSASTAQIAVPPFGTLGIDLATAILAAGFTGVDGRAEPTYAIPANPNLVGVTLYWQALVGSRFTNVEGTTFTDL